MALEPTLINWFPEAVLVQWMAGRAGVAQCGLLKRALSSCTNAVDKLSHNHTLARWQLPTIPMPLIARR